MSVLKNSKLCSLLPGARAGAAPKQAGSETLVSGVVIYFEWLVPGVVVYPSGFVSGLVV